MKRLTLTVGDAVAKDLRSAMAEPLETAGVLLVGESETEHELRLLGREFWPAPPESYRERTQRRLSLTPDAYMPALSRADVIGAAAIFVHTHPDHPPVMSDDDLVVDRQLRDTFQIRSNSPLYGSLVLHGNGVLSFTGRLWRDDRELGPIEMLRQIGATFRLTTGHDARGRVTSEAFERQVLALGPAAQRTLGAMHVGVVGLGGTGSAVLEQLTRLGVGKLTIIDDDVVTSTNVTRIHESGVSDAGRAKSAVAEEAVSRIGLGTDVHAIRGRATTRATVELLQDCDVVFACTDDHTGRANMARLATWCLIPVIDLGVSVETGEAGPAIWCRVTVQTPGSPCAICWRVVDQDRLRIEQLPEGEHDQLRAEGYIPNLGIADPSVVVYTTLTAALAVNEFLLRLLGMAGGQQIMLRADTRELRVASRAANPSHWCSDPNLRGRGSAEPFLGRTLWP